MEVLQQKSEHVDGQMYDPNSLSPYSTATSSSSSSTSPGSSVIPGMMYPEYAEWHLNGMDPQRQNELQQYQYMTYPQQTDLLTAGNYWQGDLQVHPGLTNNPYQSTDRMAYSTDYSPIPTQLTPSSSDSQSGPTTKSGKPKRKRVQSMSQRKAANIRERRRMFHLNEAFDTLRKRLPAFNYEKRLSRIETLRLAMTYIAFMKDISDGEDPKDVKLQQFQDAMGNMFGEHMSGSDGSLGEELGDL